MTISRNIQSFLPRPEHPPRKAVAALSGGVDSTFAAWQLRKAGVEVIGVHLYLGNFYAGKSEQSRCADRQEGRHAEKAAAWLDIPFHVMDVSDRFASEVILPFARSYGQGLTPNPCVICNPCIKARTMMELADKWGADAITTGHHARIKYRPEEDRYCLMTGAGSKKDQSYFLARLHPDQVARLVLPAGHFDKDRIREELKEAGAPGFDKVESQDICFVDPAGYAAAVESILKDETPPAGEIVDLTGRVLGFHPGIHYFTVGQRKGLNISAGEPYYVIDIDPDYHRLIVGKREFTYSEHALVHDLHWISPPPEEDERVQVKVRYRTKRVSGRLSFPGRDIARIHFKKPQRAITPGQYAVFYRDGEVLGCGTFTRQRTPEQLLPSALPGGHPR
ncbi:MAG: tRNA 2-thiouridine(34) synthase MnmA [bacterium]